MNRAQKANQSTGRQLSLNDSELGHTRESEGASPRLEVQVRTGWDRVASLALLATVAAVYSASLRAGFVNWDDDRFIVNNPLFHGPLGAYVAAALSRVQFEAFQPFHLLSYLPDRILWPDQPAGFHALNLAIYGTALVLGFRLLRRSLSLVPALAAVLLVGMTPLAVEPVAWVTGRKDVLALLLMFLVLSVEDRHKLSRRAALVSYLLAASAGLVKSSAIVLPLVLFAWLRYVRELPLRATLWRCAPLAGIAGALAVPVPLIWYANRMIPPERPLPFILDILGSIGVYVSRIVAPIHLAPLYPTRVDGQGVAACLVGLALITIGLLWKRLPREAKFGVVSVLGSLLPVLNIVPLQFRFADRYLLFPVALLAWPIARLISRLRPRILVMALVLPALAAETLLTIRLVPAWHDSLTLWQHAVRAQPKAPVSYFKLGETSRAHKRFADAAAAYLQLGQMEPFSLNGPAGLLRTLGESAESRGQIRVGSYAEWEKALSDPHLNAEAANSIVEQVDGSGCRSCTAAALWLVLRLFRQTDASLVSAANRELDLGRPITAFVYAMEVRDQGEAGLVKVLARLRRLNVRLE